MSVDKSAKGLYRYRRMVGGVKLRSRHIYPTKAKALAAEAEAVSEFTRTGRIVEPQAGGSETIWQLFERRLGWLAMHRSPRHYQDNKGLFTRALDMAPEYASLPAALLTADDVEDWAETWASDLVDRGKGRGEVNKFIVAGQSAFNSPWGKRRAEKEYPYNPFFYVDRFSVEKGAKYVPTPQEVAKVMLAAGGEFRLYLEILHETGARVSEARNLEWENVFSDTVVLHTIKTRDGSRKPRRLPISEALASRFKSWRREGARYVFQQEGAEAPRVGTWELKRMRATCKQADVKYFPPGCMRHYRASLWAHEGVALTSIQARLGHTQATTTNNYLKEIVGVG